MKIIQSTGTLLIGVLLVLSACASPKQTIPPVSPTPTPTPAPVPTQPPTPSPNMTPPTMPPLPTPPVTTLPPTPPAVQGQYDVWLPGHSFNPSILTVPVGTTVTWTNKDSDQHTVTSATGLFDASLVFSKSFSYTFTVPGTYEYYCNPHPDMTGKIIVQ